MGVIVPSNLEMGKFTQFAGDNIDITVETDDTLRLFGQQHDDINDDWIHRDAEKA